MGEHFRASFPQHGNPERNFTVSPAAHSVASSTAFRSNASFAMSLLTGDSSSSSSIFSASTALSQRNGNDVNRMFIDAYEDSMNVNSAAGSIAGARKPKKPWPPTIDSHRTGNSIDRYT